MLIKKPADIKPAEITPKEHYLNRRRFMLSASAMVLSSGAMLGGLELGTESAMAYGAEKLANVKKSNFSTNEKLNTLKEITTYNNFYELGVDKGDPAENAKYLNHPALDASPSRAKSKSPRRSTSTTIMKLAPLEERIYRLRCVEAWSMVIPWVGFPLSALIKQPSLPATPSSFNSSRCKIPSGCPDKSRPVRQRCRMALRRRAAHGRSACIR